MNNACKECYHFITGNKCRATTYTPFSKKAPCTFFQTAKQHSLSEIQWAEKILSMSSEKIKTYNSLYYKGRLEKYAEEIISKANQK